jgi:hypothetical protein
VVDALEQTEPSREEEEAASADAASGEAASAQDAQTAASDRTAAAKKSATPPETAAPAHGSTRQVTVKVELEDGATKVYNIHVVNEALSKPFLGGWRHAKTGIEYLNASTQTPRRTRYSGKELFHRTTQTAILRSAPKFATQTTVHTSTQMARDGCFVTSAADKVITPTVYESAADRHARIVSHVRSGIGPWGSVGIWSPSSIKLRSAAAQI